MGRLLGKYRDIIGKNTRNSSCLADGCFIKHRSDQRQSFQNSLGVWPGVTSGPPGPNGSSRGVSCGSSGGKSRMGASSGECGMGSTCTQRTAQRVSGGRRGKSEGHFCTSVCNVAVIPPRTCKLKSHTSGSRGSSGTFSFGFCTSDRCRCQLRVSCPFSAQTRATRRLQSTRL